jgi:hypothetical protein
MAEAAETAGMVIKKGHPIVRVSVYDSVETATKIIELRPKPAGALALQQSTANVHSLLSTLPAIPMLPTRSL